MSVFPVSAVVLAAGRSTRMGTANKLLLPLGTGTVLSAVLALVREAPFAEVVVVTGEDADRIEVIARGYGMRVVYNDRYAEGMGTSIARGVAACQPSNAVAVFLGDVPFVCPQTVTALLTSFVRAGRREGLAAVVPTLRGEWGHPVVIAAERRTDLLGLSGDEGARRVLHRHHDGVVEIPVDDEGIRLDLDTPSAYRDATVVWSQDDDAEDWPSCTGGPRHDT